MLTKEQLCKVVDSHFNFEVAVTKNTKLKTFRDLVVTPMNCSVFIPHVHSLT